MVRGLFVASLLLAVWGVGVSAQSCGGSYVIQRGDSLSGIAANIYRNAFRWTQVYQANVETIGADPDKILVGQRLELPCVDGLPETNAATLAVAPDPAPQPAPINISLLALEGLPPFSDQGLPNGGMITELIEKASNRAFSGLPERARKLQPVKSLSLINAEENTVPVSFPWLASECTAAVTTTCQQAILSDPVFEVLVVLFTNKDQPVSFRQERDIAGKVLCTATKASEQELDAQGRGWVESGLVDLRVEPSVAQCFEALMSGAVDAVVINEFTGRSVTQEMGIEDHVQALTKAPLSISMIYAAVPRAAPRAEEAISLLNAGLRALRKSGEFQAVLDRHLKRMWQGS